MLSPWHILDMDYVTNPYKIDIIVYIFKKGKWDLKEFINLPKVSVSQI